MLFRSAYQLGLLYKNGEEISTQGMGRHRKAVALIYAACVLEAQNSESCSLPPASLLGTRMGGAVTCVTMRQMRRTRLKDALAASTHGGGEAPSLTAGAFGRSRVARIGVSEEDWVFDAAEGEATVRSSVEDADSATVIPAFSVVDAALTLGRLLAEGEPLEGVLPHPTAALAWYRYAIRGGSAAAMYEMGDVYRRGYGIPADLRRAFALFRAAASRGDGRGLFALGVCYEQGLGVEKNDAEATSWAAKAEAAGYAPAN